SRHGPFSRWDVQGRRREGGVPGPHPRAVRDAGIAVLLDRAPLGRRHHRPARHAHGAGAGARRGTARPDRGCALRRIPHVGRQARRLTVLLRPAAPARTSPRYSRSWLSELVVDPREQRVDVEGLRDDRVRAEPVGLRGGGAMRSEEHTSELQSPYDLVCRLLLEKKTQLVPLWT